MTTLADRVRRLPSWQVALALALLMLGFVVTAQLRSEAPRVAYTSQERPPLVTTARTLQSQQDALKDRLLQLRQEVETLEDQAQGNAAAVKQLNAALDAARSAAGLIALEGSGVVLQLADSTDPVAPGTNLSDYLVSATDVRTLIQELWLAGAEAISVNGERITAGSAILDIGGSLLVNSAYLAQPYQVSAIGPSGLYGALSESASFRDFVRSRAEAFGIKMSYAELPDVVVPAYAGTVNLRYARPVPSPTASPAPSPSAPSPSVASPSPAPSKAATRAPSTRPSARTSPRPSPRPTP
jgi:uncharacterized protein YlxW (UPF0749 family)